MSQSCNPLEKTHHHHMKQKFCIFIDSPGYVVRERSDESIIHFYCHRWSYQRFTYPSLCVRRDIWPCIINTKMGDLANGLWNWLLGIHLRILFPSREHFYYLSVLCHKSPFCVNFLWHLMMRKCFIFFDHRFKIKILQIIQGVVTVSFSTMFLIFF